MTGSNRLKCVLLLFIFIADSLGIPQMKPYEFAYNVNDNLSGNDFGHKHSSDGKVVQGQYHVLLPSGQRQIVTYTADAVNGYQAKTDTTRYHVLLPDGHRQTVTYTADALNGYQAKIAVKPSTFDDSIQQGINRHLDVSSQENESTLKITEEMRNIFEELTDDQDTTRSRSLKLCSKAMKKRYYECENRCSDKKITDGLKCKFKELKNFLYACLKSGILPTCTEPSPEPGCSRCG